MTAAAERRCRTANRGGAAVDLDVGAHAHQFLHVHEAVLEDVFCYLADAFGLRGKRHVLRLHVGGKARIFFGGDVGGAQFAIAAHANRIGAENVDARAGFFKLGDHRAEMVGLQLATVRSPAVMAPATRNVPASMRSGLMR